MAGQFTKTKKLNWYILRLTIDYNRWKIFNSQLIIIWRGYNKRWAKEVFDSSFQRQHQSFKKLVYLNQENQALLETCEKRKEITKWKEFQNRTQTKKEELDRLCGAKQRSINNKKWIYKKNISAPILNKPWI